MTKARGSTTLITTVDPRPTEPPPPREKRYVGSFVVMGQPASKANSRRVVLAPSNRTGGHLFIRSRKTGELRTGRMRFIKSDAARTYAELVKLQVKPLSPPLKGDVCLNMHLYYATRRPDMDESALLDALQGLIYENDRQVKERHAYWHLDREEPRVEVDVYLLGEE